MKRHRIVALVLLAVGFGLVGPISSAAAWTGIVKGVVNADGGIFWRGDPPDWGSPIRNIGYGVYNGDQVELDCWTTGSTVPPYYNNTLWYHARIAAGLGKGDGFVNDHFLDTGINQPNIVVPGVPQCGGAPNPPPLPPPPPVDPTSLPATGGGGLVYSIYGADGGVYFRNSPTWADTSRIDGVGIYNGDQVRLICGAFGEAVGPYANRWWSKVENLTRPGAGIGWVNAHFIDDSMPANSPTPGESTCDAHDTTTTPPSGGTGAANAGADPSSAFFSPIADKPNGLGGDLKIADIQLLPSEWKNGCRPTADLLARIPGVDTLAGWSSGRMGIVYFLATASLAQRAQVHRIVMFDPGSEADFTNSLKSRIKDLIPGINDHACDPDYDINTLLADWLQLDPANRLIVLTGQISEQRTGDGAGRATYSGLWHYYFSGIWHRKLGGQVQVCDYYRLAQAPGDDHKAVLLLNTQIVEHPAPGCPPAPPWATLTPWHP